MASINLQPFLARNLPVSGKHIFFSKKKKKPKKTLTVQLQKQRPLKHTFFLFFTPISLYSVCVRISSIVFLTLVDVFFPFFNITFSISMYIMCVCLFTALSRRVGALQISIIINTNCHSFLFLLTPIIIVPMESDVIPAHTTGCYSWQLGWLYMTTLSYRLCRIHPKNHQGNSSSTIATWKASKAEFELTSIPSYVILITGTNASSTAWKTKTTIKISTLKQEGYLVTY